MSAIANCIGIAKEHGYESISDSAMKEYLDYTRLRTENAALRAALKDFHTEIMVQTAGGCTDADFTRANEIYRAALLSADAPAGAEVEG